MKIRSVDVFADDDNVWTLLYPSLCGSTARDAAAKIARQRDTEVLATVREIAEEFAEGDASKVRGMLDDLASDLAGVARNAKPAMRNGYVRAEVRPNYVRVWFGAGDDDHLDVRPSRRDPGGFVGLTIEDPTGRALAVLPAVTNQVSVVLRDRQ